MAALAHPLATVDDYFAVELASSDRYEYYRGHILAMAGGSPIHSAIIMNVGGELRASLKNTQCSVFGSDLRLAIDAEAHYSYPDVTVVCGPLVLLPSRPATLTNPLLIVEVLSPSTELVDRGRKFGDYRKIPSLREYVMVSQFEPKIEVYRLGGNGHWTLYEVNGRDSSVRLESLGIEIPLHEIYRRVEFQPENAVES